MKLSDLIPTNWLDPLLTGPNAVLPADRHEYNGQHIERLLFALRARLIEAEDKQRIPDGTPSQYVQGEAWVPVGERMPPPYQKATDGEREWYLVTDGKLYDVAIMMRDSFFGHRQLDVTHWRPIPAFISNSPTKEGQ